jgi:hypothetical protein
MVLPSVSQEGTWELLNLKLDKERAASSLVLHENAEAILLSTDVAAVVG